MASSSSNPPTSTSSVKLSFRKQISSAIREKTCPICLGHIYDRRAAVLSVCMHVYCIDCIRKWSQLKRTCPLCNTQFHSWLIKSRSSSSRFQKERLPILHDNYKRHNIRVDRVERRRVSHYREMAGNVNVTRQSRELPLRRSFGFTRYSECHIYDERVVQWRASIYQQGLQAVLLPSKNIQKQDILANRIIKERMHRRIEPWIRRELQAILHDPDPSVIVHLATSLYILSLEEKLKSSRAGHAAEDTFVQQLRPFLLDQTDMFWHELRCFAGSSFEMATYDSLVEYRHPSQ